MSPGELATFLAFYRELYRLDWRVFLSSALDPGHPQNNGVSEALARQGFWRLDPSERADNFAAIDRAIIEAEALEDMGASEVLP